jgi:DNA replication protein DnaC
MVDMKSQIKDYLRDLHLPTIRSLYEDHGQKAIEESLSYEKYLYELLERECEVRRHKKIERLLKESRLPLEKTLDSFDLKRLPRKVAHVVNSLLDGSFLERKENILSFGNPGSGKTHLLSAIGQELIRRMGKRVYFTQCSLLVQELLVAKKELKLAHVLKKFGRYDAIIIDDIGYVQQDREEMEVLFTLLAERYERGSIMLTSNLPFSKWEKIFKDPMVTAAAIDRLVHHCVVLELNIPSYRMEKAKKQKGN